MDPLQDRTAQAGAGDHPARSAAYDPARRLCRGRRAEENGYSVLFCAVNMALREMYEAMRDDTEARALVVDRGRVEARIPLF